MHTLNKLFKKKLFWLFLTSFFHAYLSLGQTTTVNLDWDGGNNAGCVPASMDYACGNNTGLLQGNWNDGTRTFIDPIPAGKIITNISITGFLVDGFDTGGLSVTAELNSSTIDVAKIPMYQDCPTMTANGTFPTLNFSGAVVAGSYNYGLSNSIRFNVTSTTGNTVCLDKAVVVLTYADAITFSGVPANTAIGCDDPTPADDPTALGGCGNISVVENPITQTGSCPQTLTRTWTATDACGNAATTSQIITVNDNVAPVLPTPIPASLTLVCAADIPTAASSSMVATNNCGEPNMTITPMDVTVSQTCANKLTITRTWSATDVCGNNATTSQSIVVNDNQRPTFDPSCQLVFTINTEGTVNILGFDPATGVFSTTTGGGLCPAAATISLVQGQIVNAADTWTAAGITIPNLLNCLNDNCTPNNLMRARVENITNTFNGCTRNIIVRFRVLDQCGNESLDLFVCEIIINDNTRPTFDPGCQLVFNLNTDGPVVILGAATTSGGAICPAAATISLVQGQIVNAADTWTAAGITIPNLLNCLNDNCTQNNLMRARVENITNTFNGCTRNIIVRFRVLDQCGNESLDLFVCEIIITDDTRPTVNTACDVTFRLNTNGTATDLGRLGNKVTGGSTCPEAATTNLVMNQIITANQTWTVGGTTIPNLLGCLTDNCTSNIDMRARVQNITNTFNGCERTFVFNFTPIDRCNNESKTTSTTTVIVRDDTAPVFTIVPADVTVNCEEVPSLGNKCYSGAPFATDNCKAIQPVVYLGEQRVDGNCPNNYTLFRRWSATDDCNNVATYTHIITVIDTIKPELTVPSYQHFDCHFPAYLNPPVSDNCSKSDKIKLEFLGETIVDGNCPKAKTYTRKYRATDECGNSISKTLVIDVRDNMPPMVMSAPLSVTITCAEVATYSPTPPAVMDNCFDVSELTVKLVNSEKGQAKCPFKYFLVHNWEITDPCGNIARWKTHTKVISEQAPVFTSFPSNILLGQNPVPMNDNLKYRPLASADCSENAQVGFIKDTEEAGPCPGSKLIRRTWRAVDACGKTSESDQIFITGDQTKPVFGATPSKTFMTYADYAKFKPATPTASDACGSVTITGPVVTKDKSCNNGFHEIILTWTATDITGNQAFTTQIIGINDATPSVTITSPTEIVCGSKDEYINANASGGFPPYTYSWSGTKDFWNILGNANQASINVYPVNMKGQFNLVVTDSRGCKGLAFYEKMCTWDEGAYCSQTEQFYGNPKDSVRGKSYVDFLKKAFDYDVNGDGKADSIFVGSKKRSLTIFKGAIACFDTLFASSGKADTLRVDSILVNGKNNCKPAGLTLGANGEMRNGLLAQYVTLAINLRNDPTLNYRPLREMCAGFKIDSFANKHLEDITRKDTTRNIKVLFNYANDVLGGRYTNVKQKYLDSLMFALKSVNECYKKCLTLEELAEERSFSEIGLNAKAVGNQSKLRWTKLSSKHVRWFTVEYSIDNQNFTKLDKIFNTLDDGNAHNYEYTHPFPVKGDNFYRILQTFKDGTQSYSNVASANFVKNTNDVLVYPNPATDEYYMTLRTFAGKNLTFYVSNKLGQVVQTHQLEKVSLNPYRFSSENLQSGVYFIRIEMDGISFDTKKLVIQR